MALPVAAAFAVIGRMAYRFATRKAAQEFVKRMGKGKVTKTAPEGATVRPGPKPSSSVNQPRSPETGKMQSPKPSPATRRGTEARTAPKKPTAPARSDSKPTAVGRPSNPQRGVATTKSPAQPKAGTGRGEAPMMPKSMVRERPNTRPNLRSKSGAAAGLRGATMPSADKAPTADTTPAKKPSAKVTPTNKSGEMPTSKKTYSGRGDGLRDMATRAIDRAESKKKTAKKPTLSKTSPKMNPLDGWSDSRRKALRSDKIGTDAGDGMKWVVGSNSNALVRTMDKDRIKENLRLQKLVKQTKDTSKKPDVGGR